MPLPIGTSDRPRRVAEETVHASTNRLALTELVVASLSSTAMGDEELQLLQRVSSAEKVDQPRDDPTDRVRASRRLPHL